MKETSSYWHQTHRQYPSLQAVGYVSLGVPFNYWMYRVREQKFRKIIASLKLSPQAKILDIGSGTGFYPLLWQRLGFKDVTASDFVPGSVAKLKKLKGIKVKKIDIGKKQKLPCYDCLTAFDILFHIVDDEAYAQAFRNISRAVRPKGYFILSENLLKSKEIRSPIQVSRTEKKILKVLRANHFRVIRRQSAFYLMNTPIRRPGWTLKIYWRILTLCLYLVPSLGFIVGPLLYPLELKITAKLKDAPSTEIIVAQKLT